MIREILTLIVDEIPTQYYIQFEKDRKRFSFHPTLKNKAAPSFDILIEDDKPVMVDIIEEKIRLQALHKIEEIRNSSWYDQF